MLWLFVALLVAFMAVLYLSKRFAASGHFDLSFPKCGFFSRTTLILAGVLGMAGSTAGGGLQVNPASLASLRLVTLDESPQTEVRIADQPLGLTAAGQRAKSNSILARRHDLAELREQIKYELRLGNITAELADSLSRLVDDISSGARIATVNTNAWQIATGHKAQQEALAGLEQSQARVNESLADTIKLVKVLGSLRGPEFSATLVAAKIQVVRLLAEKAGIDHSIDEIRQYMKRPKAG
jgi:hypothetical protein